MFFKCLKNALWKRKNETWVKRSITHRYDASQSFWWGFYGSTLKPWLKSALISYSLFPTWKPIPHFRPLKLLLHSNIWLSDHKHLGRATNLTMHGDAEKKFLYTKSPMPKQLKTIPFGAAHAYEAHIVPPLSHSWDKYGQRKESSCILLTILVPVLKGQTLLLPIFRFIQNLVSFMVVGILLKCSAVNMKSEVCFQLELTKILHRAY